MPLALTGCNQVTSILNIVQNVIISQIINNKEYSEIRDLCRSTSSILMLKLSKVKVFRELKILGDNGGQVNL